MKYNSVAFLLGYNQVFFHIRGTRFPSHLFSTHCVHIWKALLVSWERLDSKKFNLCMYILRTEKQGGSKLMFMPLGIVYVSGFGTFFRNMSYCSLFTFA